MGKWEQDMAITWPITIKTNRSSNSNIILNNVHFDVVAVDGRTGISRTWSWIWVRMGGSARESPPRVIIPISGTTFVRAHQRQSLLLFSGNLDTKIVFLAAKNYSKRLLPQQSGEQTK